MKTQSISALLEIIIGPKVLPSVNVPDILTPETMSLSKYFCPEVKGVLWPYENGFCWHDLNSLPWILDTVNTRRRTPRNPNAFCWNFKQILQLYAAFSRDRPVPAGIASLSKPPSRLNKPSQTIARAATTSRSICARNSAGELNRCSARNFAVISTASSAP